MEISCTYRARSFSRRPSPPKKEKEKEIPDGVGCPRMARSGLSSYHLQSNNNGRILSIYSAIHPLAYGRHETGSCGNEAIGENNSYRSRCNYLQIHEMLLAGDRWSQLPCAYVLACIVKRSKNGRENSSMPFPVNEGEATSDFVTGTVKNAWGWNKEKKNDM